MFVLPSSGVSVGACVVGGTVVGVCVVGGAVVGVCVVVGTVVGVCVVGGTVVGACVVGGTVVGTCVVGVTVVGVCVVRGAVVGACVVGGADSHICVVWGAVGLSGVTMVFPHPVKIAARRETVIRMEMVLTMVQPSHRRESEIYASCVHSSIFVLSAQAVCRGLPENEDIMVAHRRVK